MTTTTSIPRKTRIAAIVAATLAGTLLAVTLNRINNASSAENQETTAAQSFTQPPSDFPSTYPSRVPSDIPTLQPSDIPTLQSSNLPTSEPSAFPSMTPTAEPTRSPTDKPSASPSASPPTSPTMPQGAVPTPTAMPQSTPPMPTRSPIAIVPVDPDETFRLRMHWEEGAFWQEEERERFWCVEATQCEELNFSDDGAGCKFLDYGEVEAGNQLWLQSCRKGYGDLFFVIPVGEFQQIQLLDTDFCIHRTRKRYLTLETCNTNEIRQLWHPLSQTKFELRPADDSHDDEPFCVTQQHHPKPYEVLGLKTCTTAHRWDTGFWQAFEPYV